MQLFATNAHQDNPSEELNVVDLRNPGHFFGMHLLDFLEMCNYPIL